ncbi:hypothetical protein ACN47E_004055 [Coniothyrium glycines]
MEDVSISSQLKSTSLTVLSHTGSHSACLHGARLQIRCLTTFEIVRNIALPSSHNARASQIAWSPPALPAASTPLRSSPKPLAQSNRVLVSDEDTTRVFDLRDEKWTATVSNGSGGMGKNVHVQFGVSEDEVVVWSDFCAAVKIWNLRSGRSVEIRDPKFIGKENRGWGLKPASEQPGQTRAGGVVALLCRTSGADVLLLLAPHTYTTLNRIELHTTDAAGIKWSRDGRWLAVWDAPSAGYKLCIYTADGHLYRTITREPLDDASEWAIEGLGIKSVEWCPGNAWLAVGGWDRRVRILSTRTFAPAVYLDHTSAIDVPTAPVYTELVDGQGNRSYSLTPQPATPPKATLEKNETGLMKTGISLLTFNSEGTLCATRDDSTPSTVWIWDLRSLRPRMILIQYAPIKNLLWHPTDPTRLLIQTTHDSPTVYLYTSSTLSASISSSVPAPPPSILDLSAHLSKPANKVPAKWSTAWLATPADKKPVLLLGHQQSALLLWPDGKDVILRFDNEDDAQSDDSLYEILTGKKAPPSRPDGGAGEEHEWSIMDEEMQSMIAEDMETEEQEYEMSLGSVGGLDDTFRSKRKLNGHGVDLGQSGMSEMF